METVNVIVLALNQLIAQLVQVLPKLIIALIIWYVGKYLINFAANLVRKIDIKRTTLDDKAVETLALAISLAGRVILVLVVLDYLGIGRSVVSAVAQGLTFAVAIALGLAFGKALEPDADHLVKVVRKFLHK